MNGLPVDVVALICAKLPPINYMSFRLAWSLLVRRADKFPKASVFFFRSLCRALVERLGPALGKAICASLRIEGSDTYITGGFALSVLQGDPIDDAQDIDLFITEPNYESDKHPLVRTLVDTYLVSLVYDLVDYEDLVNNVRTGFFIGPEEGTSVCKIQFLTNATLVETRRHLCSFDFPFCSNLANAHTLQVKDPMAIILRSATVDLPVQLAQRIYSLHMSADHFTAQLSRRMAKYRARNYVIDVAPFTEEALWSALGHLEVHHCPDISVPILMDGRTFPAECGFEQCPTGTCAAHWAFYQEACRRQTNHKKREIVDHITQTFDGTRASKRMKF